MKNRIFFVFVIILTTILFLGCSKKVSLDDYIRSIMEEQRIPSIAAYTLGSLSKLVIVTAIMQLNEKGLIALDEDINTYLPFSVKNPNFPNEIITANMLLNHTSGLARPDPGIELPGFYYYYPGDTVPPMSQWIKEYIVPGGENYVPELWRNTAPGTEEWYSNIGATLLAYIVEVIMNENFNTYCKKNIFTPLQMPHSTFKLSSISEDKLAVPYNINYFRFYQYAYLTYPAGFLRSSVEEFSHFIIAYMNGGEYNGNRILKESTINNILTAQNTNTGMCKIWYSFNSNWYGHSGFVTGGSTHTEFQKDSKVGFIVFSNTHSNCVIRGGAIPNAIFKITLLLDNQS
jgi:CubicO group peptidase (beta-lactamase class C family)